MRFLMLCVWALATAKPREPSTPVLKNSKGSASCETYKTQNVCEAAAGCTWYSYGYDICYESEVTSTRKNHVPSAPTPEPAAVIEAALEIDVHAFKFLVDLLANMSVLSISEQQEVQEFATDVVGSYISTVAATLGVAADDVKVTCIYRMSDLMKINLLTLNETCEASRQLLGSRLQGSDARVQEITHVVADDLEVTCTYTTSDPAKIDSVTLDKTFEASRKLLGRRLQSSGFSVHVEITGEGFTTVVESGEAVVANALEAAPVEITRGSAVVRAVVGSVGVEIRSEVNNSL